MQPPFRIKKLTVVTGMSALAVSTVALFCYISAARAAPSAQDFVRNATIGGLFEINSSKVALQRSQNEAVKHFAHQMVDDHSGISKDLDSTLPKSQVDPSQEAKDLDPAHQQIIDSLQHVSDQDLDQAYIKAQRQGHEEAVKLFREYSSAGSDEVLKSFASRVLPTLEQHQRMANNLRAGVVQTSAPGK